MNVLFFSFRLFVSVGWLVGRSCFSWEKWDTMVKPKNYINFQFYSVALANIFSLIACHPLFQIPESLYLLLFPISFFLIPRKFISFRFNFLIVFGGRRININWSPKSLLWFDGWLTGNIPNFHKTYRKDIISLDG